MSELRVNCLVKTFKSRKVVKNVSFSVASGEVIGLLGPNGAGKTTSFYMVVGLISPDEGQVLLDDLDISRLPMFKRARIGISYLPQEASVFRRLTVRENLLVALEAQGLGSSEKRDKMFQLLEEFNITHISDSFGYALSGGERRRVEIARSLAGQPKFLLLDEPFAGIDPIAVGEIQNLIRRLQDQNIGILITDHNVRETLGICDKGYILKEGQIEVQGTAQEIASSPVARRFYLGENFRL